MSWRNQWGGVVLLALLALLARGSHAQTGELVPFSSVTGSLTAGETQNWTLSAVGGEVVSLRLESDDALDPVLTLLSETGAVLLENDDIDYPASTDAILQAVTMPFTGTFTVQVSGFAGTEGSYTLTRLRGFADGLKLNGFVADDTWDTTQDALTIEQAGNTLTLALAGNNVFGLAMSDSLPRLDDYYAQVSATVDEGDPGWAFHMTARQASATSYYMLSVNHQGFWRFAVQSADGETVLRDWISHPAIQPGETTFDLGTLANDTSINLFYNGSPLGTFVDDTLADGIIGFGIETSPGLTSETAFTLENFYVTVPMTTGNGDDIPQHQFIIQEPMAMAHALENQRAIPTGGELMLNVPTSSVQSSTPGVSRIALGRGTTFENFVVATNVTVETAGVGPAGCGIYLRAMNDENYALAYLDETGSYGLAQRQGDTFLPGVFGQSEQLQQGGHQLLVIAQNDTLQLYINGRYMGGINSDTVAGEVGNAALNFEQSTTTCSFEDTWLWRW